MADCLFCRIVEGRELHYKVSESKHFIAILNLFPVVSGHVLILPKSHTVNLLDIPESCASDLLVFSQRVAKAVMESTGADSFNFALNNGVSAGQSVMHTHFHIIPRKKGDNLHSSFDSGHKATPQELVQRQKELVATLSPQ